MAIVSLAQKQDLSPAIGPHLTRPLRPSHRTSTWISDGTAAGALDGFGTFVAIE
jgi:hypothetical protein